MRPHPSYPDNARAASPAQVRNPTDAGRPASRQGQRNYPPYGHPSAIPRHIDPNALATSGYPYAASQPIPPNQYQAQQAVAGVSSGAGMSAHEALSADRSSSGRYECQWCGKGFTRPSSLKASPRLFSFDRRTQRGLMSQIHMNTHTGEKRNFSHHWYFQ